MKNEIFIKMKFEFLMKNIINKKINKNDQQVHLKFHQAKKLLP